MLTKPDFIAKKLVMVFASNGEKISCRNDNIVVEDKDGNTKLQQTCYSLFAILIIGNISVTSGLIQKSKKFNFSILFFSSSFKLYASINFALAGNTLLRQKQYEAANSIEIAKNIVINKIRNQCEILKRLRNKDTVESISYLNSVIEKLQHDSYQINEIMGMEGVAAKVYFNILFKDLGWKKRQPRVKPDEINLLLDIGYTALFNYLEALLNIYGFDVFKGNLHQEFFNRKSLVCDMIEPFRPIIDYKIKKMIKLKQTSSYKYKVNAGQFSLGWSDSAHFLKDILSEITHYQEPIFTYIQQYYRWFMKDQNMDLFPWVELNANN